MQSIFEKTIKAVSRSGKIPCLFAALLFLFFCAPENAFAQKSEEYTVKAAFILNFAKFSKWPEEAFANSGDPVILCVIGKKRLKKFFKNIKGKNVGNRSLDARYMNEKEDVDGCHILFVSEEVKRSSLAKIFDSVKGKPVLTIGEMPNFASDGGVINFITKNKKLRFEINREIASQQKINLSSRLLQLAIIVNGNE